MLLLLHAGEDGKVSDDVLESKVPAEVWEQVGVGDTFGVRWIGNEVEYWIRRSGEEAWFLLLRGPAPDASKPTFDTFTERRMDGTRES